jgi:FtsP/CotA-like multicopper oxidase with cupredoxin domain
LIIHVTNNLDTGEGVSIHWHGLEMRNSINMDGAVGFTQCPNPANKTFVYDFVVDPDQAGTFWWHAHSQVERGDGMYGGLVVHKPIVRGGEDKEYEQEEQVLLLVSDWYHRNAEEVLAWYTSVRGFGNEVRFSPTLYLSRRQS